MNTSPVISKDNPLVRTIRLVAAQARRAPPELVMAEGLRVLEEATRSGCSIESVLVSDAFGTEARERALVESWGEKNIPVRRAASALLRGLSGVVSSQGAIALVRVPHASLETVTEVPTPLILCLCGVQDPGNLGTLLRTARAAGVSWVGAIQGSVSARNPKAIRSSAGAFFHLKVIEGLRAANVIQYCRARNIPMYLADLEAKTTCWSADLRGAAAFFLGNEAVGLPGAEWREIPPIRVPMNPGVESLNVAAAGAVLLFEAFRQRSRSRTPNPSGR
jgi:TrmH family RNA methyltransferase